MNEHIPYHHLSQQEALESLGSDHAGLTWTEVEKRWHQYGQNIIERGKGQQAEIPPRTLLNPRCLYSGCSAIISLCRSCIDAMSLVQYPHKYSHWLFPGI